MGDFLLKFTLGVVPQNLVAPAPLLNGSIQFLGVLGLEVGRIQDDVFVFTEFLLDFL